jgi:hypothetical protein
MNMFLNILNFLVTSSVYLILSYGPEFFFRQVISVFVVVSLLRYL